jgi:hypothetical protein
VEAHHLNLKDAAIQAAKQTMERQPMAMRKTEKRMTTTEHELEQERLKVDWMNSCQNCFEIATAVGSGRRSQTLVDVVVVNATTRGEAGILEAEIVVVQHYHQDWIWLSLVTKMMRKLQAGSLDEQRE